MPQSAKDSNQTSRYDGARVALLRPVEAAIGDLKLPLIRLRKLNGILNALTMQIEDGGDSREVNRLLLDALRAAVRHQADDRAAQGVLRAIDAFEETEAGRWRQIDAGTLPPIELTPDEELDELIERGYALLHEDEHPAACDRWLEAWQLVKQLAEPSMRTTAALDDAFPHRVPTLSEWCQDLEMELGHAGAEDAAYHEHRLRYAREVAERFPDEDVDTRLTFAQAQAEALWDLGRRAEAEAAYVRLVESFPDEVWGYISWADQYWTREDHPKDYARAEAILNRAMARPNLNGRLDLLDSLEELYEEWGKPARARVIAARRAELGDEEDEDAGELISPFSSAAGSAIPSLSLPPAPAPKLGRNDPCWCGSGKKYKRCHL